MKNEKYWKKRQEEKLTEILDDAQVTSEYISSIYSKAVFILKIKQKEIFEKYKVIMDYQKQRQKDYFQQW